jgi:ATP synthase protein I
LSFLDTPLDSGYDSRMDDRPAGSSRPGSLADTFRTIGALSTVGISFVLAIVMGFACGYYLDRWLGTGPWLLLVFTLFGLAAGILNVYRTAGRFLK